jgi:caffeoylshikimate esterase
MQMETGVTLTSPFANAETLRFISAVVLGAFVHYCYSLVKLQGQARRADCDNSDARRRIHARAVLDAKDPTGVRIHKKWAPNSRGMILFQQCVVPLTNSKNKNKSSNSKSSDSNKFKGVIGICHGFGDHTSDMLMDVAVRFCREGFVVLMMDIEGHGLSDGIHGYLDDLKTAARDYSDYFMQELASDLLTGLPFFIYGISMGGAIAFNLVTLEDCSIKNSVKGAILSAPMIKISEELKPPEIVTKLLILVSDIIPCAPVTPTADLIDKCFKSPAIVARARNSKLSYHKKPRLKTSVAMLNAIEDIEKRMPELRHPILIIHGSDDKVTSWKDSSLLHEKCNSKDKEFKLYKDCWHELLLGGADTAQTEVIFSDIVNWIEHRL